MNYSKEYMTFLEAHRRSVEFKDKMKQAAIEGARRLLEDSVQSGLTTTETEETK